MSSLSSGGALHGSAKNLRGKNLVVALKVGQLRLFEEVPAALIRRGASRVQQGSELRHSKKQGGEGGFFGQRGKARAGQGGR